MFSSVAVVRILLHCKLVINKRTYIQNPIRCSECAQAGQNTANKDTTLQFGK